MAMVKMLHPLYSCHVKISEQQSYCKVLNCVAKFNGEWEMELSLYKRQEKLGISLALHIQVVERSQFYEQGSRFLNADGGY